MCVYPERYKGLKQIKKEKLKKSQFFYDKIFYKNNVRTFSGWKSRKKGNKTQSQPKIRSKNMYRYFEKGNNRSITQSFWEHHIFMFRSSHPEVFLREGVLVICSKFTGEHPRRSAISIKLRTNFIEIALLHGCSAVNLLHIFRKPFPRHISGLLLLNFHIHIFRFATQHWYCISDRFSWHSKSSRPNVFCKKAVQESFAESIEKHLCLSLFLIKVQTSSLQFYLTEAPVFSGEFWEIFKNTFFVEVLRATASRSKCQFCI